MSHHKDKAKSLLLHYLKLAAEGNRQAMDTSDCVAEIDGIVDELVDAAVDEVAERERQARDD